MKKIKNDINLLLPAERLPLNVLDTVATVYGYEVYVGGKGGAVPHIAKRIAQKLTMNEVLDIIATLVDFHERKTISKQRLYKLLDYPEFPHKTSI